MHITHLYVCGIKNDLISYNTETNFLFCTIINIYISKKKNIILYTRISNGFKYYRYMKYVCKTEHQRNK